MILVIVYFMLGLINDYLIYYFFNDRGLFMYWFDKLGFKCFMNKIKYGDEVGNGVLSLVFSLELVDYVIEICLNGKGNYIRS